jgi:hypothetical protein
MRALIKKVLVKLELGRKSISAKIEFGRSVGSAMKDNENFVSPSPTLEELGTATDNLEIEKNKASLGNHEAVQNMYKMEFIFNMVMTNMGKYVETTANNKAAIIVSAGMKIRNTPKETQVPGQVVGIIATPVINTQTVKLKWKAVEFTVMYFIYQSTAIEGPYELAGQSTGTKFSAKNLTAGTIYFWKIEARNGKGTGPISVAMFAMAH